MTMRFNGGQMDGQMDESVAEDLVAEWDDSQKLYLVYDEEGQPRGAVRHAGFQIHVGPDGTPHIAPIELPRPWYRNRRYLPYAFSLPALLTFFLSGFFATSTRLVLLTLAFVLMLVAFQLSEQLRR